MVAIRSRRSVGTATTLSAVKPRIHGSIPGRCKKRKDRLGAHLTSYSVGTWVSFPGNKVDGA
jgi:hypothetical protein